MYNNWNFNEKEDGNIKNCICPKCNMDMVKTYNITGIKPRYFDFPKYCPKCGSQNYDENLTNGQVFQLIFGFDPSNKEMEFYNDTFFSEEYANHELYKDLRAYYDIDGRLK